MKKSGHVVFDAARIKEMREAGCSLFDCLYRDLIVQFVIWNVLIRNAKTTTSKLALRRLTDGSGGDAKVPT